MQIMDAITQLGALKSMANELGVSEAQAATGANALLPAILGGFQKHTEQAASTTAPAVVPVDTPAHSGGLGGMLGGLGALGGLGGLLGKLGGGGLLDDVLSPHPTDTSRGNEVLGQIFGSKDTSRVVAQNASQQSGLDPALLKRMLPMLAMVVGGIMMKHHASQQQGGSPQGGTDASGGTSGPFGGVIDMAGKMFR